MKKKVLLLSTSFEEVSLLTSTADRRREVKCTDLSHYPLGVGYLHSYLETRGHEVKSLWLNNTSFEECRARAIEAVDRMRPEVVGLQVMTVNRVSSYRLIEEIHERYPDISLIAGGVHATIMHEQLVRKYPYLIVVIGEGELTLSELVERLPCGRSELSAIDGISYWSDSAVKTTEPRALIQDLDSLPFPKHEEFWDADRTYGCLITSRGCPFGCSFCCLKAITRRKVRTRSVANVIEEVEHLRRKFPRIKMVFIHDDTFFLKPARVIALCDEIAKRHFALDFICSGRIKPLTPEMVSALERAGFVQVLLGLESGDAEVLRRCHKGITPDDAVRAFKLFARSRMDLHAFLIVGLPGETEGSVLNTAALVKRLQRIKYVPYDNAALLTVYPGTEIYELSVRAGNISDEFWLSEETTPLFTAEHSQERLFELKELLLDHICLDRVLTRRGFAAQLAVLPSVIWYVLSRSGPRKLKVAAVRVLRLLLPGSLYGILRTAFVDSLSGRDSRRGSP